MRPLDPRLRHIRPARSYLTLTVGLGLASAGLVVAQALLIAALLAPAIQDPGVTPSGALFVALGVVVAGRAVVAWAQERYARRAASRTIADLREQVVDAVAARPPRGTGSAPDSTGVATLVTRGLDDLEPYLVRYVPQLVLTALLTPALVLVVLWLDWISAIVVAVTLPLVPVFMVLVGRLTAGASERRLAAVGRLGEQVLDLVAGLPTLRAFGRAAGPAARVRTLGDASRRATMRTLRVAFLSSMVLELLTTLSVAIVAVGVGLRLVEGQMDLQPAIAVLVLAPEVYLPLRRVGAEFHASVDGVAAAGRALDLLAAPGATGRNVTGRDATGPGQPRQADGEPGATPLALVLDDVHVRAGERGVVAPAGLSARIPLGSGRPGDGRVVALRGPSGSGKSTAVLVALGLVEPDSGRVLLELPEPGRAPGAPGPVAGRPRGSGAPSAGTSVVSLGEFGLETWWRHVTWVPQRPAIPPGTLRDILHTPPGTSPGPDDAPVSPRRTVRVARAAQKTGLDGIVRELPGGWDTRLGLGGAGLSVGQRQRVALTAALLDDGADRPLVILDEPTAHLDARSEGQILDTVRAWRGEGRTVLVVAHRASLLAIADEVIDVEARPVSDDSLTDADPGAAR
ncbi:thiol reductant ABC exporter subunit CydD [Myceligenerans xiligouense]|uniref:ATP-binding cassette subfamily C protein CydD n=1 Tax=Myceligenerans xiligouense TaxID=253184 RepID=A0A3N4YI76_9MICO|nr:thiol reductant ABC exporter subunit CydD [Myceligenerans xiligouense]RPF20473.1 ATP-binding cassette subfamily C protein CydD [Myceligenerans xiligouense]